MATKQQKTMTAGQVELMFDKLQNASVKNNGEFFIKVNLINEDEAFNLYYDFTREWQGSFYKPACAVAKSVVLAFSIQNNTLMNFYFELRRLVENYKIVSIKVIQ